MSTLQVLVEHSDIKQAFNHHRENNFSANVKQAIYAFWANDVERDENGKFIEHYGKATALNYQKNHKNVYLMENFEGTNNVLVLNDYEKKQDVSLPAISAVCALASASYAKSASGTVLTSVKGANINSFFRTNELPLIMDNPNITHIINVSRNDPDGRIYEKKEAYHALRDEWLDSAIDQFEKASRAYQKNEIRKETYESLLSNMAAEIVLSQKAFTKKSSELNIPIEYKNHNEVDQKCELIRIRKCIPLIQNNPELKIKVNELNNKSMPTMNNGILHHFSNLSNPDLNKQPQKTYKVPSKNITLGSVQISV